MCWKRLVEMPWELLSWKWAMTFTGHSGTRKPERLEDATSRRPMLICQVFLWL